MSGLHSHGLQNVDSLGGLVTFIIWISLHLSFSFKLMNDSGLTSLNAGFTKYILDSYYGTRVFKILNPYENILRARFFPNWQNLNFYYIKIDTCTQFYYIKFKFCRILDSSSTDLQLAQ